MRRTLTAIRVQNDDDRRVKNRSYRRCIAVLAVTSLIFIYAGSQIRFDSMYTFVVADYNRTPTVPSYIASSSVSTISSTLAAVWSNNSSNLSCGYFVRSLWQGRLGNQMFFYASFYGMVRKLNVSKVVFAQINSGTTFSLDSTFENLSIPYKIVSDQWLHENGFEYIGERGACCAYSWPNVEELVCDGKNVMITGWRQSYKYFDHVADDLKKEFTFKVEIREQCQRLFERSLVDHRLHRNECIIIGVHLRRGDFATPGKIEFGHMPASEDYLVEAIRFYETKFYEQNTTCVAFMVFGDDYEWNVKASQNVHLLEPNLTRIILSNYSNSTPAVDMCMMSLCDHMIISTGTYSWWAGFFSRGMVVRQKEFARNGSVHITEYKVDDYFPPSWIPL